MGGIVKNKRGLQGAKRLLTCQLGITAFMAAISVFVAGPGAAFSAMLGGVVSIVPNACFAWSVFRYQGAKAAKKIVNGLYKGEAMKIALSLILFALVFAFFQIKPIVFFVTYILAQMVFWFAPLIFDNQQNRPESD